MYLLYALSGIVEHWIDKHIHCFVWEALLNQKAV